MDKIALWELPADVALRILETLKTDNGEYPAALRDGYRAVEASKLSRLIRGGGEPFKQAKEEWRARYPEFRQISEIVQKFQSDLSLGSYAFHKTCPKIRESAIEVYMKCLSHEVMSKERALRVLDANPNTADVWSYYAPCCIRDDTVRYFLKEYQRWHLRSQNVCTRGFILTQDFWGNMGYKIDWAMNVAYRIWPETVSRFTQMYDDSLLVLRDGRSLIEEWNGAVTAEYQASATGVSLYERARELKRFEETEGAGAADDEQYCRVYTLECEICVFYVGIAADPSRRYEQHVSGAFGDEAHLLKSKFIRKYHGQVKLNIVHEGTRRECKLFERQYIAQHSPLGNMTQGGEG